MYALIDCNSFFASVEKAFHPGLRGKPVCVLSSNDGCIVALTPEAKAAGLHRGEPIFKCREAVERHHVKVFSTNMMLYAAMSKRVTGIIRQSVEQVENYSIDESFCNLDGYERHYDIEEYMRQVAQRITTWTDIPVSVGVAPTKTLAKMGSKFAKQYRGYRGVCMIDTDEKRRKALELFDLADVWGVGRRSLEKLHSLGVTTPLQFADKPLPWVRNHFSKPGYQTWLELNGHPCIDTAELVSRQSIGTSRTFGDMVCTLDYLKAAVATFAASCATKLRAQHSVAGTVTVFICSNPFRDDLEQYSNAGTALLHVPTADTIEITEAALGVLGAIWNGRILYKRAGVMLGAISSDACVQQKLFDPIGNRPERQDLSRTMDMLNQRYGLKTVSLAVEGESVQPWKVHCDHKTPNYLTDIREILTVRI